MFVGISYVSYFDLSIWHEFFLMVDGRLTGSVDTARTRTEVLLGGLVMPAIACVSADDESRLSVHRSQQDVRLVWQG